MVKTGRLRLSLGVDVDAGGRGGLNRGECDCHDGPAVLDAHEGALPLEERHC